MSTTFMGGGVFGGRLGTPDLHIQTAPGWSRNLQTSYLIMLLWGFRLKGLRPRRKVIEGPIGGLGKSDKECRWTDKPTAKRRHELMFRDTSKPLKGPRTQIIGLWGPHTVNTTKFGPKALLFGSLEC